MENLLEIVVPFFSKKKYANINQYYRASILGNRKHANIMLRELLKIFVYEENILNIHNKELEICLEKCDIDLKKLRIYLENMKGVNIDIIEQNLISY